MDLESSLKKLLSLHTFGIKLGLDNTIGFLNYLGNPQNDLKCIHVAGSNGKGSTSSFIASLLQEFGFKIGLYTSPHFVKFNERVVINGIQIEDEFISTFISDNEKYIDENKLTFFEVTTALAFQYFKEMKTDYCVIETGLGGRLDATNVLNPLAVVITSISLEHTNVLGTTIEQIANEKAAIIKNGSKAFTGLLNDEARDIIKKKCEETNCVCHNLENFISEDGNNVELILPDFILQINPPLKGKYQKYNASLAILTVAKTFGFDNTGKYLEGISKVSKNTGLQGRYEYFNNEPAIIFDSAHNPDGVENFLNEFSIDSKKYKKRYLIFGVMKDKAIDTMIKKLSFHFDEVLLSRIQYERAAEPEEIEMICKRLNVMSRVIDDPVGFIEEFKSQDKKNCLVVLGSMYLLGEIKQQLLKVNA